MKGNNNIKSATEKSQHSCSHCSVAQVCLPMGLDQEDLLKLEKIIMPLLKNLQKNPDDIYIKWPNRKEVIDKQIKKIVAITRS